MYTLTENQTNLLVATKTHQQLNLVINSIETDNILELLRAISNLLDMSLTLLIHYQLTDVPDLISYQDYLKLFELLEQAVLQDLIKNPTTAFKILIDRFLYKDMLCQNNTDIAAEHGKIQKIIFRTITSSAILVDYFSQLFEEEILPKAENQTTLVSYIKASDYALYDAEKVSFSDLVNSIRNMQSNKRLIYKLISVDRSTSSFYTLEQHERLAIQLEKYRHADSYTTKSARKQ